MPVVGLCVRCFVLHCWTLWLIFRDRGASSMLFHLIVCQISRVNRLDFTFPPSISHLIRQCRLCTWTTQQPFPSSPGARYVIRTIPADNLSLEAAMNPSAAVPAHAPALHG